MKIGGVDFPEPLLNALRDGKLVVFAGAGVSMGPPARLPSFRKLAEKVADGTGQSIAASETDDQFLGRLKEDGVRVHQRATEILQPDKLKPNALHRNLLRLFQEKDDPVRVVTTNFDCLFEQAAELGDLFRNKPKVFEAPALPPGSRFEGIVRLHGSVKEAREMVLTHRDFGRAYLTEEEGWARRFLVSLFANHTVLFVGYSHSDTIMTYLTPSLPPDGGEKRFALVGSTSNDLDRWRRMGIETIKFHQQDESDFTGLDKGVKSLADFRHRRLREWQNEIITIAAQEGPLKINDEASDTINYVLGSLDLTQLFTNAAKSPEWIAWLDDRGYLKSLFNEGELEKQDESLSRWLACQFVRSHSNQLLSATLRYHGRLNGYFWNELLRELKFSEDNPLESTTLSRWVHLLMSHVPRNSYKNSLLALAKHCAKVGALQSLLQVYDVMTARLVYFLPDFNEDRSYYWSYLMKKLWKQCLTPNLRHIAHTLLERTTMRLEQRYAARIAWEQNNDRVDPDSRRRPAIESHKQDEDPYRIDPLIDVVRDCLEWLVINEPMAVKNWCNRFINSDPPLLRRLAIHTTNARKDLSVDDKMAWLLEHCDANKYEAHHEIFRMAGDVYPEASSQQKKALIQAISQYQAPAEKPGDDAAPSAYHQFNWFQWLHNADPNCSLLEAELARIRSQYPQLPLGEDPDFNSEAGWIQSPWSVETLLAKPASEWLPSLLDYQSSREEDVLSKERRYSLLLEVYRAAKRNSSWGLDLADAMAAKLEWKSGLWERVISAWEEWGKADLDQESTRRVLSHISTSELHQQRNARAITGVLNRLIRNPDAADLTKWLDTLHKIAIAIHPHAVAIEDESTKNPQDRKWNEEATKHPSGKLAEFWLHSISHWYNQQAEPPQALSPEYRRALDTIIHDVGVPGKLGRNILVSWLHSLHYLDSTWAENHLLPLFDAQHEDFSCAWDGLTWGHLSPQVAELLQNKLVDALPQAVQDFHEDNLKRFIQVYVNVMSYLIKNDKDKWIYTFFQQAREKPELKHIFTTQVGRLLRNLDEGSQKERWNVWLKDYWNNRLQGVPCPLDNAEIATMFEWVIYLQGVFSEAVAMAVQMGPAPLKRSLQLHRKVSETNLINRYPNDLARFLIHLGKCETPPWFWYQDSQILHHLLEKDLPEELANELDDLILRIEISTGHHEK